MFTNEFNYRIEADDVVIRVTKYQLEEMMVDAIQRITDVEGDIEIDIICSTDPHDDTPGDVLIEPVTEGVWDQLIEKGFSHNSRDLSTALIEMIFGQDAEAQTLLYDVVHGEETNPEIMIFLPFKEYIRRTFDL